ncbi:hypothetical protein [Maridesulfovibrio bastinii]|uniref:hypothetical protein n=1 Tax=Maridesulfovibrio bastinii TaxID=47157 RepID=UPI000424EEAB|nr:hypothetical protein [Maridesulfovibrio bastinii]
MFRKFVIILLLSCFMFPQTVFSGRGEEDRSKCIALEALARSQCKDPLDYVFVGKYSEDVYIYNTFYGSRYRDFFCKVQVENGTVTILSRKRKFRRQIEFHMDKDGCALINFEHAGCPKRRPVRCCLPKTAESEKKDKEDAFWDRPVPELLKEDQKAALEELQNRTSKASEATPEEQSKE